MASIKPINVTTREQALETVKHSIELAEQARRDLASNYAFAAGGTAEEHELGESLTKIRAAIKRMREAFSELIKQELPLE